MSTPRSSRQDIRAAFDKLSGGGYSEAESSLPTTADEARDQAHAGYLGASALIKQALQYGPRSRRRRRLLDVATPTLSAATWMLLEERRLREAERENRG